MKRKLALAKDYPQATVACGCGGVLAATVGVAYFEGRITGPTALRCLGPCGEIFPIEVLSRANPIPKRKGK